MADGTPAIGHNNPPAETPDPFTAVKIHCEDLYMEAKHWLDGGAISSDAEAAAVERLLDEARKAWSAADEARIEENKPFDLGKAAVQDKYAPLIAKTKTITGIMVRMQDACKAALEPWRKKKAAEAAAIAEEARRAAQAKAEEAAAAMRASAGNLEDREVAEELVKAANQAARDAGRAEKAATTGTGLTTYYEAVLKDTKVAMIHYMKDRPADFIDLCKALAAADVREGIRTIPGFTVEERKRAR